MVDLGVGPPNTGVISVRRLESEDAGAGLLAPGSVGELLGAQELDAGSARYTEILVSNAAAIEWLRNQREAFFGNGGLSGDNWDIIVRTESGGAYGVAYRDAIPFEDAAGAIPALSP